MFLELKRRFDRVYTGEINNLEIDFIAIKNSEPVYFQICKNLESESTLQREIKSLLAVKDNYPKYIITYDKYPKSDISGIKVINIIEKREILWVCLVIPKIFLWLGENMIIL